MASLTGQKIKDTYQSLLKTNDNGLVTNTFKNITDGSGSSSGLYLKNDGILLSGSVVVSGSLNATSITSSLQGTASWAENYNETDPVFTAVSGTFVLTSSFGAFTSSYNTGSFSGSLIGSLEGTSSFAITASYALNGGGGGANTGDITFEGIKIIGAGTGSGDGFGYSTMELVPDNNLYGNDQYVILDPTTPNHIHIRAGGAIDSSSAYLYLGGEKANVVVRNLDNSFNEKHWVQINSQTGSTQNTWTFDADGKLSMPGALEQGDNVVASGLYSHAEGSITQAIGDYSHAEGDNNQAIGNYSHAEGQETISSGSYSHAEGYVTQTIGSYSHTEGAGTVASGSYSHAEGFQTIASGSFSHAEGSQTQAIGQYSHAEGESTKTGTQNAYSASIIQGIVTMSAEYGDVTSDFPEEGVLYFRSIDYTQGYSDTISQSYYDGINGNTILELYSTNQIVTTYPAYVGLATATNEGILKWTGNQTIAAVGAHAEGSENVALGDYSSAKGRRNNAIGIFSHAEGAETRAIGDGSHSEGTGTKAIGPSSHAEGGGTKAMGESSHAEGYETQAIMIASHAEGYQTVASASLSHAEGGNTLTIGDYSHAEGRYTRTIGTGSHSEGFYATASGNYSHAEGAETIASGSYSHAEGFGTRAIGDSSHAEGGDTRASGPFSHAEGISTYAIGYASHAEGDFTTAIGNNSHAEGSNTIASGSAQHVSGKFNQHNNTGSLFVIGIGLDDSNRKDGFTVDVDVNGSGSIMIPSCLDFPENPKMGSMYFDPINEYLWIYTGVNWRYTPLQAIVP